MNKLRYWGTVLGLASCLLLQAQEKFYTKSGKISFFSTAPVENITALNKTVICLLNSKSGDLQFAVLLKGFEFRKALMQEHFNSDYVESDKYPKAEFAGQITNNATFNYSADGSYSANVKGKLTIHGITNPVETTGTITIKNGQPVLHASFSILLANYKISIPKMYRDNISSSVKITVDCALDPLK